MKTYAYEDCKELIRKYGKNWDKYTNELEENLKTVNKGDLFYTSWGYDQTNYDYIVVMEISSSGKTVKCQRTSYLHMGESCQSNIQEPIFCPFGEVFRMQIRNYDYTSGITLVGSYPFLSDGEGSKRKGYFGRIKEGNQFHETMAQFGH